MIIQERNFELTSQMLVRHVDLTLAASQDTYFVISIREFVLNP